MIDIIRKNIRDSGFHIYLINGGSVPRFLYTIGLTDTLGFELIFAGAAYYSAAEAEIIVKFCSKVLKRDTEVGNVSIAEMGEFHFCRAHESWANPLMLGALDYYKSNTVSAMQIVPDAEHWTIDTPDMTVLLDTTREPVWQWTVKPWTFAVPTGSTAITNLQVLRGNAASQVARWEEDYWEIFSGDATDIDENNTRAIPLGTLLAIDSDPGAIVNLEIGHALQREIGESAWREWRKAENSEED